MVSQDRLADPEELVLLVHLALVVSQALLEVLDLEVALVKLVYVVQLDRLVHVGSLEILEHLEDLVII